MAAYPITGASSKSLGQFVVPDPDEKDPARFASFFKRVCDHQSPARRELEFEWYVNKLMYESIQWLDIVSDGSRSGVRVVEQEEDEEDVPQTINNEILPIIDTHRSRLGKRRSQGYVRARRGDNAKAKIAATKGDDVLSAWQESDRWPSTYRDAVFSNVLYGTGVIAAEWMKDYRETTRIAVLTAKKCPTCPEPFVMADRKITPAQFRKLPEQMQPAVTRSSQMDMSEGGVWEDFSVDHCLRCGAPMMPYTPIGADLAGKDFLGRPLGNDVPIGEVHARVPSLFDFFVENEGIQLRPGPMGRPGCPNWYAEDSVECVDNIACLYEKGEDVKPESPEAIAREKYVFGEHGPRSGGRRDISNRNLWSYHSRLHKFVQGPTRKHPLGRLIVYANKVLLINGDLYVRGEDGRLVPQLTYAGARFYVKEGEYFGQGAGTGMWSQQRRINMSWSQITDNRERNGVDSIMLPEGGRLESRGFTEGFPGRVVYWSRDPEHPDDDPTIIEARLSDGNAYKEIEFQIARMQNFAGLFDQDIGKAPQGLLSGTAIQLLGDKSSERGEMRDAELVDSCKEVWTSVLQMKREFVREPRKVWVKGIGNQAWQEQEYRGADLDGQTDVLVDEEPHYDKKAFDREMTVKAIEMQLLPTDTAYARREARRELGVQNNVADQESRQLDDAERKWHVFAKEREVPAIEPNEDDHKTYWEVYGLGWKSEEGLQIKQDVNWDSILPLIAGWEKDFKRQRQRQEQFEQLVLTGGLAQAQQMASAGTPPPVPPPPTATDPAMQVEANKAQQQAQAQAQQAFQTAQSVVQEWANYVPPPEAIELHILQIWLQRLEQKGVTPDQVVLPVLKMKALGEAHYMYATIRAMAATAGQPAVAAPAAEQTPAGTEPAPTVA